MRPWYGRATLVSGPSAAPGETAEGVWSGLRAFTTLLADVRLPTQLFRRRRLRRRGGGARRLDAGAGQRNSAQAATAAEVHQLRERRGPGGHGMVAEPDPLLHLRPALRHVRRGGGLHLPVGGPPQGPRRVRPGRDGGVHRHPGLRAALRLAQGSTQVGVVESGRMPKPLTQLLNTARKYSLWIYQWGLACCGLELGAAIGSPRYDIMRLGVIPFPSGARQADLVVIAGTVTDKMSPPIRRLYEQMPDPKYVISMGSCSNCGGPYWDSYSVTKGVDQIIPVDVYVPGCPPRPEALLEGIVLLQQRIQQEDMAARWRGDPIVVGA